MRRRSFTYGPFVHLKAEVFPLNDPLNNHSLSFLIVYEGKASGDCEQKLQYIEERCVNESEAVVKIKTIVENCFISELFFRNILAQTAVLVSS